MKKILLITCSLLVVVLSIFSQHPNTYKNPSVFEGNISSTKTAGNSAYTNQQTRSATSQELLDLEKVRSHYPLPSPRAVSANSLNATRSYINSFNIVRNGNEVVGDPFPSNTDYLTTNNQVIILQHLEGIAYGSLRNSADSLLFQNFIDHIINEEILYKFPALATNNYTPVRSVTSALINIVSVCSESQRLAILDILKWVTGYSLVHESSEKIHKDRLLTIDHLFLLTESYFYYACYLQDDNAVAELKNLSRFFEITTEYHDGDWDILKRDGTSFHHWTHYIAYMYGYNPWIAGIASLKDTQFKISLDAYTRLKKGMVSIYIMSNRDPSGNYHANSLSGRHPLYGLKNPVTRQSFESMIEIGGDILGTGIDTELAAQYNYFFSSDKYDVNPTKMDGYYQFNYSPLGIYRKDNWVVTMRSPTTNFWGAEIYSGQNRFGRYQSHGTLEIMYDGTPDKSGIPTSGQGWDWNVVPGTTTVHYTNWLDMMPSRNTTTRFDQYTKTRDYAGALAWDDYGIFTSDFDQSDTWGNERFTPTNLEFKKTVFAFNGMLISLGSDIKSSGNYSNDMITATNLFQSANPEQNKTVNINGQVLASGSTPVTLQPEVNNWIITPEGTGYYIPKGNAPLVVKNNIQEGPKYDGSNVNNPFTVNAAKGYINHGTKPTNGQYFFVVIPGTNPSEMSSIANQISSDGGDIFSINSLSSSIHSISYKPQNITAYSFFQATNNIAFGRIKSVASEMLVMEKEISDEELTFAVANPNLRPAGTPWVSTSTSTSITIEGSWKLKQEAANISVNTPVNNQTTVRVELAYGEPIYFSLVPYSSDKDPEEPEEPDHDQQINISLNPTSNEVTISFLEPTPDTTSIEVFSLSGSTIYKEILPTGRKETTFTINGHFKKQVVIILVKNSKNQKVIKIML